MIPKDKIVQVCDEVCYQMFWLQQSMKNGDKDEILLFFEQYFNDEEEMELQQNRKKIEEVENHQLRLR